MMVDINSQLESVLRQAGVTGTFSLTTPPNPEMGELAFACFSLAKEWGKTPNEIAKEIELKIKNQKSEVDIIADVKAFGPYVNFFLDPNEVAKFILKGISSNEQYGELEVGRGKQIMVEFGCPNPMKAFHLGHLKNLITGESIVRLMENAGYDVIRANYQGDVGMHIAKTMWGLFDWKDKFDAMQDAPLKERVEFLGKAYAHGATAFENDEKVEAKIREINAKVYQQDVSILDVYTEARQWSLEYFDTIYNEMQSSFDRFYFESETFKRGIEIVKEGQENGIFKESEGAVIFPGSEYDLHDRVYLNSEGYPTYDAKELALSEMRFDEFPNLSEIIHVVGKEQTEYFKVVFKAIEALGMKGTGKESHLPGGFLQLKGEQKMSSRKGNIVTGDELIAMVRERIAGIMSETNTIHQNDEEVLSRVTAAALKYVMLRADISKDVAFDLEESISTSGNSGPYLLYIVARINSILKKAGDTTVTSLEHIDWSMLQVTAEEKELVLALAQYPLATTEATNRRDTSIIAKYLFDLAQVFNSFYHAASVLDADQDTKVFRLHLIAKTRDIMTKGLYLLGIDTVESM